MRKRGFLDLAGDKFTHFLIELECHSVVRSKSKTKRSNVEELKPHSATKGLFCSVYVSMNCFVCFESNSYKKITTPVEMHSKIHFSGKALFV